MNPAFKVESIQPEKGYVPRFQRLREKRIVSDRSIFDLSYEELRAIFLGMAPVPDNAEEKYLYSPLDVLYASASRVMSCCSFCCHNCRVNRYIDAGGRCGLGSKMFSAGEFIHIAEEIVVNPALTINLGGCALRCIYCIEHEFWDTSNLQAVDPRIMWETIRGLMRRATPTDTLEFTNPTESLAGILDLLGKAPNDFDLPVLFNCHLYGSKTFYEIAGPIVDAWIPDMRYGNNACAKQLSGVDHYMEHAVLGLEEMRKSGGKILCRILVLPGHGICCHEPAIRILSEYKDTIWLSILDQFVPEHEAHLYPKLNRRPTRQEIAEVENLVERYGLRNISVGGEAFWRDKD